METLEEKIDRVVKEDVAIVQYDPRWPQMFKLTSGTPNRKKELIFDGCFSM